MLSRSLGSAAALAVLFALLPSQAVASRGEHGGHRGHYRRGPERHAVPEFDPSVVGAIAAVVTGGALLVARRRKP